MRKDSGETRERALLDAIGNLPEDMIAKAAEYSIFQKETGQQEKRAWHKYRRMICKGLAAAACLVLVMAGANKGGELFRQYADRHSIVSEEKEIAHHNAPIVSGDALGNNSKEKEHEVKIWTDAAKAGKGRKKTGKKDSSINSSHAVEESADSSFGRVEMQEGATRRLRVEKADGRDGEKILATRFTFGDKKEESTYLLHSQMCKIVSVTEGGVARYVNLPDADCKAGGTAELDVRRFAVASWAENPVPEWENKKIAILDIINISVQPENGKEQEIGKLVIGVKGKKYYGIFKKP